MTIHVTGFFCEDIREEQSGQVSIVGILPDNIQLPKPPEVMKSPRLVLPKLGLYVRIRISMEGTLNPMPVSLIMPNGERLRLGEADLELIEKSRREALAGGIPIATIIFHALIQGFTVAQPGLIIAVLESEGIEYQFAVLNVKPPIPA
jgi:hypothetical protein